MSAPQLLATSLLFLLSVSPLLGDRHVVVVAHANPDYARNRYAPDGSIKSQGYVVMEGNFYGGYVRDRTLERTSIRDVANRLAPELAKRKFFPSPSPAEADLLLVVHWGTTSPTVGTQDLTAKDTGDVDRAGQQAAMIRQFDPTFKLESSLSDISDSLRVPESDDLNRQQEFTQLDELTSSLGKQSQRSDNATLLGYNDDLRRDNQRAWVGESGRSLRHDLDTERYFIIVRAYELRNRTPGTQPNRPVWTMNLNIRSPGNNFDTALSRMSLIASQFAGTNTDSVRTVRVRRNEPTGSVTLGEMVILGEADVK
jgi:hypothetical protein